MLFNSYEFIFVFLPVVLGGMYVLAAFRWQWAVLWLFLASLAFYGGWSVAHIPLLVGSISFNFLAGWQISQSQALGHRRRADWLLRGAVAIDLLALGYFKYATFLAEVLHDSMAFDIAVPQVDLPLGISFFTFTQIAFLVDARRAATAELSLSRYGLFVSYYPHLIAGPILHHREMMEQFQRPSAFKFSRLKLASGITLFTIGLAKKVVIADNLAPISDAVFFSTAHVPLTVAESWAGALAYTLQLYFDFSGYSDMALGLALMMGVRMPLNFNSPYKALSIIDFWRRWHMTLSQFLRDYLYIPLGGSRRGSARHVVNITITMFLGGLWHGAGWTFIIWGLMHGGLIVANHGWRAVRERLGVRMPRIAALVVTLLCVIIAWVMFRANTFSDAVTMYHAMFGANGLAVPNVVASLLHRILGDGVVGDWVQSGGTFGNALFVVPKSLAIIAGALFVALALPNSQEILRRYRPALAKKPIGRSWLVWRPTMAWGIGLGVLAGVSLVMMGGDSPFLYFRF